MSIVCAESNRSVAGVIERAAGDTECAAADGRGVVDIERAGIQGRAAGVGVGGAEGQVSATVLDNRASAGDRGCGEIRALSHRVGAVEDQ